MTKNDELAMKLKQTAQLVHDNEQISNYGKLEAWKVRFRHTASPANILALLAERDADKKRIAELEASHQKLRESMAAIHNTIRADGAYTPLAAIMSVVKRAYEDSAAVAGIKLEVGE